MHDITRSNWRDHLKVHPAADLFPLLLETDPAALKELAEDIRQHGQREPASYIKDSDGNRVLLDGRNRLDALEMLGRKIDINDSSMFEQRSLSINAQAFIISKNIHRRHLTPEKKRDLIGLLLKANPEKSDRQIAKTAKSNRNTVGRVRAKMEATGDVSLSDTRTDTKGRKQPARRLKHANPDCPDCGGNGYFKGGDSGRCHCVGVSQVLTALEKRTSGLPTGSDSSKNPVQQAEIAESETQPNPILEAFNASTVEQRQEFIEGHGDFIADWNAIASSRKKDAPLKYRIWSSCTEIEMGIDGEFKKGYWVEEYESIADQLSKLEQAINEAEAEDEEDAEDDPDDDLNIPDYLKRAAP